MKSKPLSDKSNITDSIETIIKKEFKVSKPVPRRDWDESFIKMHSYGDDKLLIPDVFKDENLEEWI